MGRAYSVELRELAQTYEWAARCPIEELAEAIHNLRDYPLLSVGSGGSFTVAVYWAMVQELWTGMPAKHGTPLDLLALPSLSNYSIGLVSARGSNPDIVKAFEAALLRDSRGLVAITFAESSKLANHGKEYPKARVVNFHPPIGKDGFLATNSLVSFMVLIHRAYAAAAGREITLPSILPNPWTTETQLAPSPTTYSILYAGWATAAAIDIESKLVEGGLADVHHADLRNFAHGRHHWLARRGEKTTVVALVTPEWSELVDKTLAVLPPSTRIVRLESSNDGPIGAIELVNGGLSLIGEIASLQAFDPGRPSVPEFGRKLYRMNLNSISRHHTKPSTDLLLRRKLGGPSVRWPASTIAASKEALVRYLDTLRTTRFQGVVFDYDETLCPTANRFGRLPLDTSKALTRIVGHGVTLGIASGRGRSVGQALRESLEQEVWERVIVGYYNGGCVLPLSESDPPRSGEMEPSLASFNTTLQGDSYLQELCEIEPRPDQITLTPRGDVPLTWILELVLELAAVDGPPGIAITQSSHSIDVLGPGVSKLAVVDACIDQITEREENGNVLRVGDSGTWSGNDLHLLSTPLSLSVADCPKNPSWAWNLAAPGRRGPQAALDYMDAMEFARGAFTLDIDRLVEASS